MKFNNSRGPGMPDCYRKAHYLSPLPELFLPPNFFPENFIKCKYIKEPFGSCALAHSNFQGRSTSFFSGLFKSMSIFKKLLFCSFPTFPSQGYYQNTSIN